MNQENFSIIIANDNERENVFAEIYYNRELWAEISIEGEHPVLVLFPPMHQKFWEFPLDEALQALEMAKKELIA